MAQRKKATKAKRSVKRTAKRKTAKRGKQARNKLGQFVGSKKKSAKRRR